MKVAITNDHRGYELKKYIIKHMKDIEFVDLVSKVAPQAHITLQSLYMFNFSFAIFILPSP